MKSTTKSYHTENKDDSIDGFTYNINNNHEEHIGITEISIVLASASGTGKSTLLKQLKSIYKPSDYDDINDDEKNTETGDLDGGFGYNQIQQNVAWFIWKLCRF
eukprot:97441_1